jgi:hypothetical protein
MYTARSSGQVATQFPPAHCGHFKGEKHKPSTLGGNAGCRLMEVSVSILGLTGILMENKSKKKSSKKSKAKYDRPPASTSASMDDDDGFPVKSLVSFFKDVNGTAIASHIPSLALRSTVHDDETKVNYNATWPTDFDPIGNELSTFKFSRTMQIDDSVSNYYPSQHAILVPERIQLTLGLTRGSEMVTIGSAFLIITGEEAQDVQFNLPINLEDPSKKQKKKTGKNIKPISFDKDPTKKFYNLRGNACLKVLMSVSVAENSFDSHANLSTVPEMMPLSSGSGSQNYETEDLPIYQHINGTYRSEDNQIYQHSMGYNRNYVNRAVHDEYHNDYLHHRNASETLMPDDDNDETTVGDYTCDETVDETVMTDDTRNISTFARMTEWLACIGGMCSMYPLAFQPNQHTNQFLCWSPEQSIDRNKSKAKRVSRDDNDHHLSYEEYKKRMMEHSNTPRLQRPDRRKKKFRDDCSVATEKIQNHRFRY